MKSQITAKIKAGRNQHAWACKGDRRVSILADGTVVPSRKIKKQWFLFPADDRPDLSAPEWAELVTAARWWDEMTGSA